MCQWFLRLAMGRWRAGGPLGDGNQWMSWVHIDDLVGLMMEAVSNDSYKGVYNGTAPHPVRMSELCSSIGSVKGTLLLRIAPYTPPPHMVARSRIFGSERMR